MGMKTTMNRIHRYILAAIALVCLAVQYGIAAEVASNPASTKQSLNIIEPFGEPMLFPDSGSWGVCCHTPNRTESLKPLGVHWIRLGEYWTSVEVGKRGNYNWVGPDRVVNHSLQHGFNILYCFAPERFDNLYEADRTNKDVVIEGVANWMAATAAHFKGKGLVYELGNEPEVFPMDGNLLTPNELEDTLLVLESIGTAFVAGEQMGNARTSTNMLSPEALKDTLKPLDSSVDRIQGLIGQAASVGAETRYFESSLAVIKRYRKEIFQMKHSKDPGIQDRTARFLLECADRTEKGLEEAIRHPKNSIRVPKIDLQDLKVRDGSFFSGNRPVMLAGLCGWFAPGNFDYLSACGYTVLATEIGPSAVFPTEGALGDLRKLTSILDTSAQHNMKVDLLLSAHYIPKWQYEKWPDLDPENRRKTNRFMPWDVRCSHLKTSLSDFLDVVIPQVRNKSALLNYDLINEAWYRPFGNLDRGTLDEFEKAHPEVRREDAPEEYTTGQVTDFIKWYASAVAKRDDRHPIYVKVLTSSEVLCVDREAIGDILTANGMDKYPECPDRTGVLAADFAWTLLRTDFHRSLTPDKPILDGEYHPSSGIHNMPDSYFRTAMWAPALHGVDSAALWVYGRVDDVSIDWHVNAAEVLGHTALDFLRLGTEIHAFQQQQGPIAVYYGRYHDNYRSRPSDGIREAYLASLFQDVDIGILTEKRAKSGALSKYKVLVLPDGCALSQDVSRAIDIFKKSGGIVVQCAAHTAAKDLWPTIHSAVAEAHIKKFVSADKWGVECRSIKVGSRRLFYLINYNREPVDIQLKSSWPLSRMLELRTRTSLDENRFHLEPLEFKLLEII